MVEAEHLCIMARGVGKQHAFVKTSAMLGSFEKNTAVRKEFLTRIK